MPNLKVYLDNCCYNRPYDDQSYINVSLETQAKLYIQSLIVQRKIDLASSFVLDYENSCNKFLNRQITISNFQENAVDYIDGTRKDEVLVLAEKIQKTGLKTADACHVACAELMKCNYFITTDYRVLKYHSDTMQIVNPIDFIQILTEGENDK